MIYLLLQKVIFFLSGDKMKFLNTKQMIFVLLGVSVVSLKTYPTIFVILGARDTWIAVIAASFLIFLIMDYLLAICKGSNCFNLYQIYKTAVGKPTAVILLGFLLITVFLNMAESTSMGPSTIQEHFLPYIPIWIFIAVTVLCGLYVAQRKGTAIITATIITIVMICISGITLAVLTQKYKNFSWLFPVFGEGLTLNFIHCVLKLLGCYGCVFLIFPFLEHISDKSRVIRHTNYGILFLAQVQIFSMIGNLTTFNVDRFMTLIYPKLTQSQMISYFAFLEAGELFVMLQVIAGWFIKYILCFFALLLLTDSLNIRFKAKSYVFSVLSLVFAVIVANNLFTLMHLINVLMYIQLANYVIIPIIVFTVFLCRYQPARLREKLPQQKNAP